MIIIIIIIFILVFLLFLTLKRTVKTINKQAETYFVDKLQSYDDLIKIKEDKLSYLNESIKDKENALADIEEEVSTENIKPDYDITELLINTKPQTSSILDIKHLLDEKFNIDSVKIIENFILRSKENLEYDRLKKIKDKLDVDNIYKIESLFGTDKEDFIKLLFDNYEYQQYINFINLEMDKSIYNFLNYLDYEIQSKSPYIYVLVGNKQENYDYLSDKVKTIYDGKIYKGIKIKYKNKIYDYSISEGRGIM